MLLPIYDMIDQCHCHDRDGKNSMLSKVNVFVGLMMAVIGHLNAQLCIMGVRLRYENG